MIRLMAFGLVINFFTLYPESTVNHSNDYAMNIIMNITGEAGGDTVWRNLCVLCYGL